jgi:hypothetical protein
MHTSRITNASLFVTVLSACLGLSMTGVSSAQTQAQHRAGAAVNESHALVLKAFSQHLSPQKVRKLAATNSSYFQLTVCHVEGVPAEIFYQNSRALGDKNHLLVVTRLPRAALVSLPAEQTGART